jgi:hypothetical protein
MHHANPQREREDVPACGQDERRSDKNEPRDNRSEQDEESVTSHEGEYATDDSHSSHDKVSHANGPEGQPMYIAKDLA